MTLRQLNLDGSWYGSEERYLRGFVGGDVSFHLATVTLVLEGFEVFLLYSGLMFKKALKIARDISRHLSIWISSLSADCNFVNAHICPLNCDKLQIRSSTNHTLYNLRAQR